MLFGNIKFYGFFIALIIMWLVTELGSLLGCIIFLFWILLQSIFIQLIVQLNNYIYKFIKNIDLILQDYIIFIIYNFILDFFLKSLLIYILKNLIISFYIISVLYKFR